MAEIIDINNVLDMKHRRREACWHYADKYGEYYNIPALKRAYGKAKTIEERTIIRARIDYLNMGRGED